MKPSKLKIKTFAKNSPSACAMVTSNLMNNDFGTKK